MCIRDSDIDQWTREKSVKKRKERSAEASLPVILWKREKKRKKALKIVKKGVQQAPPCDPVEKEKKALRKRKERRAAPSLPLMACERKERKKA